MSWLWAVFTLAASGGQVLRNAMQKELTATLGMVGATQVRFLFGLPFALAVLAIVLATAPLPWPELNALTIAWTVTGAIAQIGGTALLLAVMQRRSFIVTTAYVKTEPVQVAVFGLIFLGDQVTPGLALAILVATAGVLTISWPPSSSAEAFSWKAAGLGLASGALFAIAAIGFRGGIRALDNPSFLVGATTTLVLGLLMQVVVLSAYLLLADRATLVAIIRAWRPSLVAGFMGAFASADVVPGLCAGDGR
jgi:drug/metabolite transporter (DMT)-like permease